MYSMSEILGTMLKGKLGQKVTMIQYESVEEPPKVVFPCQNIYCGFFVVELSTVSHATKKSSNEPNLLK